MNVEKHFEYHSGKDGRKAQQDKATAKAHSAQDTIECLQAALPIVPAQITQLVAEHAALVAVAEAAAPFNASPFSMEMGGNVQGGASPIYARNGATLTLGDFRKIQSALAALAAIRGGGK